MIFYLLLIMQICIVRFWIEFIWKSIRSINDSFVMVCITVIDIFISFIFSAGILLISEGFPIPWRISHNDPLFKTVKDDEHHLR